jgi:hypothetical protein
MGKWFFVCLCFLVAVTQGCSTPTPVTPTSAPTSTPTPEWWADYGVEFPWNPTPEELGLLKFWENLTRECEADSLPGEVVGVTPDERGLNITQWRGDFPPLNRHALAPNVDTRLVTDPPPGASLKMSGTYYSDGRSEMDICVITKISLSN